MLCDFNNKIFNLNRFKIANYRDLSFEPELAQINSDLKTFDLCSIHRLVFLVRHNDDYSVSNTLKEMRLDTIENLIFDLAPPRSVPSDWNKDELTQAVLKKFNIEAPFNSWINDPGVTPQVLVDRVNDLVQQEIDTKMAILPEDLRNNLEKSILIQTIDQCWKEHLHTLDFIIITLTGRKIRILSGQNYVKKIRTRIKENMKQ